jgi:hypothetical protein
VSQLVVSMLCLLIAWRMWSYYVGDRACRYCGHHKGHKQDCPFDLNREER